MTGSHSFPEDSVQSFFEPWWVTDSSKKICRGRLIKTFIHHIDLAPHVLTVQGRGSPTDHNTAVVTVEPFNITDRPEQPRLPVAALPLHTGEHYFIYRGKIRPALVLAVESGDIDKKLATSSVRWQTAKTIVVAPYYGADKDGTRGGWDPTFVQRIRRATYPQYMYDCLPIGGVRESIMRIDQMQALGSSRPSLSVLDWKLSDEAMSIVDEWVTWYMQRRLAEDGDLLAAVKELQAL